MELLVELSGEHPTLPHAELAATIAAEGWSLDASKRAERLVVGRLTRQGDGSGDASEADALRMLERLAMCHRASEVWHTGPIDLDDAKRFARAHALPERASFAVRAERLEDLSRGVDPENRIRSKEVAQVLGEVWSATNGVDLDDPRLEVRALMHHDDLHIGRLIWENDRSEFEWRAPKRRPHFSPVSGHPRLMRALVNLARVPTGGTIYDPLCGTGGILVEAGLAGLHTIGSDVDDEMVQGTETNCAHFGVDPDALFTADVRDAPERLALHLDAAPIDAVVADLPYGQSASTKGATPKEVAAWTFEACVAMLEPGKRAVIGVGNDAFVKLVPKGLVLREAHEVRAHKSRTRTYVVLERAEA